MWAEVNAVTLGLDLFERQALRLPAETVAIGTAAEFQFQQAIRPLEPGDHVHQTIRHRTGQLFDFGAGHLVVQRFRIDIRPPALNETGQAHDRLPFRQLTLLQREDCRRIARGVAPGELVEEDIPMAVFKRRCAGQDDIGVAGRLVEVDIKADQEVERVQRSGQLLAIG